MAWLIQPLELIVDGAPSGKWRLTARSDEDGGGPYGLCECENGHVTAVEAYLCPEAVERSNFYG